MICEIYIDIHLISIYSFIHVCKPYIFNKIENKNAIRIQENGNNNNRKSFRFEVRQQYKKKIFFFFRSSFNFLVFSLSFYFFFIIIHRYIQWVLKDLCFPMNFIWRLYALLCYRISIFSSYRFAFQLNLFLLFSITISSFFVVDRRKVVLYNLVAQPKLFFFCYFLDCVTVTDFRPIHYRGNESKQTLLKK